MRPWNNLEQAKKAMLLISKIASDSPLGWGFGFALPYRALCCVVRGCYHEEGGRNDGSLWEKIGLSAVSSLLAKAEPDFLIRDHNTRHLFAPPWWSQPIFVQGKI
jgi:hypothetical protein